jgi:EAL domain-containing protein (putative c-di-GMP-specific phosphodiesterase class I)
LAAGVGDWIVDTACRQAAAWRQLGFAEFRVALNLFSAQLHAKDLTTRIFDALERSALPPCGLELEITENLVLAQRKTTLSSLQQLRKAGVGITFDDYGTGYACLSSLKHYPITTVKIDRSFTGSVCESAFDATVVRAISSMAASLNVRVLAEGVETQAQLDFLDQCGCEEAQGNFIGKPVPAALFSRIHIDAHLQPVTSVA